jgi:Holliday junction resolvase RusA-like endonuclease
MKYHVTPIAKPRMTRSDKWKQRDCVLRYRAYKDLLLQWGATVPPRVHLIFELPMPPSWGKKKRAKMYGTAHKQKPDLDNLIKGVLDATLEEDSGVWQIAASKRWGEVGSLTITGIGDDARKDNNE